MNVKYFRFPLLFALLTLTACGESSPTSSEAIVSSSPTESQVESVATPSVASSTGEAVASASKTPINSLYDLYDSFGVTFGMSSAEVIKALGTPNVDSMGVLYYPFDQISAFDPLEVSNQRLYITYDDEDAVNILEINCDFDGANQAADTFATRAKELCGTEPLMEGADGKPYLYNVFAVNGWDVSVSIVSLEKEQSNLFQGPLRGSIALTERAY